MAKLVQDRLDELLKNNVEGDIGTWDETQIMDVWQYLDLDFNLNKDAPHWNLVFYLEEATDGLPGDLKKFKTMPNPYPFVEKPIRGKFGIYLLKQNTIEKMIKYNHFLQGFQKDDGTEFGKFNQKGYKYQGLLLRYSLR